MNAPMHTSMSRQVGLSDTELVHVSRHQRRSSRRVFKSRALVLKPRPPADDITIEDDDVHGAGGMARGIRVMAPSTHLLATVPVGARSVHAHYLGSPLVDDARGVNQAPIPIGMSRPVHPTEVLRVMRRFVRHIAEQYPQARNIVVMAHHKSTLHLMRRLGARRRIRLTGEAEYHIPMRAVIGKGVLWSVELA
jgi:hypothetical protein